MQTPGLAAPLALPVVRCTRSPCYTLRLRPILAQPVHVVLPERTSDLLHKSATLPAASIAAVQATRVSLWFALRAAVLRRAVSWLWPVALEVARAVAAEPARLQNASMVSAHAARAFAHTGLRPRLDRCPSGCSAVGPAVRANPSLKRTRTGIRSAWPISWCHAARLPVRAA